MFFKTELVSKRCMVYSYHPLCLFSTYPMIPSLTHLSVLAIPRGVSLTGRQHAVLRNIQWGASRELSNTTSHGQYLNSQYRIIRSRYEAGLKCGIDDDIDDMCVELRQSFDDTMAYRNEMARESLYSSNYVYMDWLISNILFSPPRWTESEELFHMLKGSSATWKRISPKFDLASYTPTERELHNLILRFKSEMFRNYLQLDKSSSMGIDEIQEISLPLIDISKQCLENGREKIFLKRVELKLNTHIPYYYTFDSDEFEEGELVIDF